MDRRVFLQSMTAAAALSLASQAKASGGQLRGVTDDEIVVGQTNPYSGPASVYSAWYGKVQLAYCDYINSKGGINGRKLRLISYDDGYQPPRTIEQVRRLVEVDKVAAIFMIFGTAGNEAVKRYVNTNKVPMLFAGTSASEAFADPERYPYSMPYSPSAGIEAAIFAKFMRENYPGKKIAVLYQQDDIGASVRAGLRRGLGDAADLIVAELPYNISDPTVDSQIVSLQSSGAEIFYNSATIRHAVQGMTRAQAIGWNPITFILNTTTAATRLLEEAGSKMSDVAYSSAWFKDPANPAFADDPAMIEWKQFMADFYPGGDTNEPSCVLSTAFLQALIHVLTECGDDLSTENIMRVATNMQDVEIPMLLPGIRLNTTPTDYFPITQLQMITFSDKKWSPIGDVMSES